MPDVYDHRVVDCSPKRIVELLCHPGAWLEDATHDASACGQAADGRLRARLGLGPVHVHAAKRVHVEVAEVERAGNRQLVPVTWEASGFPGLFPVMDCIFDILPLDERRTHVVFWGRYDPPLGRAGDVIDRYLAHNVAQATVSHLLDALAIQLGAARVGELA